MVPSRISSVCFVLFPLVSGIVGCALPHKELGTYREAIVAAREAGEQVLLDHSASRVTFEKIKESRSARLPENHREEERLSFNVERIGVHAPDAVLARIQAWEVLTRYSDALVVLAEGRGSGEIENTVNALLKAVTAFSVEAAVEVAPFAGVIKIGIAQMQRAIEMRKFREAVAAADGCIAELCALLIQDTNDFYGVRLGIRNYEYSLRTDQIADARTRLFGLLGAYTPTDEDGADIASGIKNRFDAAVKRLPDWGDKDLLATLEPGNAPKTPLSTSVIEAELTDVERWVTEAVRIDSALLEYRNALYSYILLVHQMRAIHSALASATKKTSSTLPSSAEMMRTVVAVRRSINAYRELQ